MSTIQSLLDCIDDYAEKKEQVRSAAEGELTLAVDRARESWERLIEARQVFG